MMQFYRGLKQSLVDGVRENPTVDAGYDRLLAEWLNEAQTILFSSEQAEVLLAAASRYDDTLEYRLPFNVVFLQFSAPLSVSVKEGGRADLCCLLLIQYPQSDAVDPEIMNSVWGWYKHTLDNPAATATVYAWESKTHEKMLAIGDLGYDTMKAFAVALIGYINCENIYLEREGEVPDKVNRKREKQGKKILEPYYVCRIRGVQYDSNGEPIGEGARHGFRYDVRGHFRKLNSGRTTWVRPHQRGLQHELYVPKTYVVAKEPTS